jgi:4-carboxymuconolactone decarboxylase
MTAPRAEGPKRRRAGSGGGAEDRLRHMALSDASSAGPTLNGYIKRVPAPGLDHKTDALVRLAALIAAGASPTSYRLSVDASMEAGATVEEVLGTLLAVAPTVGLARLVSATPRLALAVGYDIDAALERVDVPSNWSSPDRADDDTSRSARQVG